MNGHGNIFMRKAAAMAAAVITALSLTGCDDLIYDGEGDCNTSYTVTFTYTMNMEYADAFSHYVQSVTLCAFDTLSGTLVYKQTAGVEALGDDGKTMSVDDITPGTYTLVAWAEGEPAVDDCYEYADLTVGTTTLDDVTCRIARGTRADSDDDIIDHDLTNLFHAITYNADLTDVGYDGERNVDMDLTKNTNSVRIVLQHLSGSDIDVDDFSFEVTSDNGMYAYDNSLISDGTITYTPWSTSSGTAALYDDDSDDTDSDDETLTSVSAAVAEMTIGRLVYGNTTRLTVYNSDGDKVLSIPVIDYALLIKGNYSSSLTNQEYLDRQDEYSMTFFLDENDNWISSTIIINSWRLVFNDVEL